MSVLRVDCVDDCEQVVEEKTLRHLCARLSLRHIVSLVMPYGCPEQHVTRSVDVAVATVRA